LDEIGNISMAQQAKLLRVLQTGEIERVGSSQTLRLDVRIISATNRRLDAAVAAGDFREDLLYRLNTVTLELPPLRERQEDILPLAYHFLRTFASTHERTVRSLTRNAAELLRAHHWPGNIRELQHTMERAVLIAEHGSIDWPDLGLPATPRVADDPTHVETIESGERRLVADALTRTGRNIQQTARILGISRGALYRRMERFGL
jgi:transcriptional regulator with PAS, ATPase and Fis domain